jgi:hypothetical protein
MGKGSKPQTPEASANEKALADISLDMYDDYKTRYRGLEDDLIDDSSVDRTSRIQGRSHVDTQKALSANNDIAVNRAATSGGLGSGASLSNYDAGGTGGALAVSNQGGFVAGRNELLNRKTSALSAIQAGEDVSREGIAQAANVANRNTIASFQDAQNRKLSNAQMVEAAVAGGVQGYMQGQQYGANQQMIKDTQAAREAPAKAAAAKADITKVQNRYMSGPMQLAAPAQPFSLYTPPGVSLPPYQAPNQGISFVGYNSAAPKTMPLGFGVRR